MAKNSPIVKPMKKQTLLLTVFLFLCQFQLSAKPDGNINDKYYRKAFSQILSMLEGQEVESFKDAVFHVENAYFDGKLSYSNYNYKVHQLVQLSRLVANQNSLNYRYSDSTNIKINYGVASVLMDSIKIRFNNKEIKLSPSRYDFEDITGESDWTKMFVSKLLHEGTGNCHSLPYLYKILVEAAGGTTHLALAPHHIYIKTPSANNKIGWYNTELTNHSHPNDGWIIASGYISLEAIQNGLYMQPLDHKASLALCLLDLAQGYIKKFPHVKNDFVITCINTALNYYPNCVNGLLLKAEYLYKESGISEDLNTICQQLIRLGYDQMPQSMYLDWLTRSESTADSMDKFQEFNNELGNPFGNVDKAPTLSKGRYAEFHELEVQEMIGSLIFNTNTQEVVGEKQEGIIQPTIVSRFLSVDPLAPEYPWYTPYQFAGNKPIQFIDLDGLEEGKPENGKSKHPKLGTERVVNGRREVFLTDGKQSVWYPKPSQQKLDDLENNIYKGIERAENDGYGGVVAPSNLRRYMNGVGGVKTEDVEWLLNRPSIVDAINVNMDRFYYLKNQKTGEDNSIVNLGKQLQNGESIIKSEDNWSYQIDFSILGIAFDRELYWAYGNSELESVGTFEIYRENDILYVTGKVEHTFSDDYDWHIGKTVRIPGYGTVKDEELMLMEVYKGAKTFEIKTTWTQNINETYDLRE